MTSVDTQPDSQSPLAAYTPPSPWRRALANPRVRFGGGVVLLIVAACVLSLPWTLRPGSSLYYTSSQPGPAMMAPSPRHLWQLMGTNQLTYSLLSQCLLGGAISLGIGIAAATISVVLGVTVGMVAGYQGGWIDAVLMRIVDVLYALPYILMVILLQIALGEKFKRWMPNWPHAANLVVLFFAIGLVSWLTMARVVRGQVLSLRSLPFIEAAHALGVPRLRIFLRHLLPNLVGPITVYATLIIPQAILQESLLSFLGVGIQSPLPTWGSLASDGLSRGLNPVLSRWWLLVFPCTLLAITLLALNFVGDGLRDVFDPRRDAAKL